MQRTLWPVVNRFLDEIPERELLDRHVWHRDQDAFAQLVARYSRLVWGQCRNLLANEADAEDAFQATFVTLARSAKSLRTGAPLGPWLHGVAYRVCMNARRAIGRRAKREGIAARSESQIPVADSSWEKAFAVVAEEVQSLPEDQRVAFVLCYIEGRSAADAAARLGLKLGTYTARVSRAKQSLLERVAKRGLGAGFLVLGGVVGNAAVAPAALVERTLEPIRSGVSVPASVQALTHGVPAMKTIPFKLLAAVVAGVGVAIATGFGGGSGDSMAAAPPTTPKASESDQTPIAPDTRKAINAGLEFLAKNQADNGSWVTNDYRGNGAITALAGRAFLADHQPGRGPHGDRLTKAIEYVLRSETNGLLAQGKSAPMFEHGFAVRFLAEAYGKVDDKPLKDRTKATLTRAIQGIADGQNREGGWRYRPESKDADISVTCCQLHALAAARRAGFKVPEATVEKGIRYVLTCRNSQSGLFQYVPNVPSAATAAYEHTAAALSALHDVGYDDDQELLEKGTEFIRTFKSPGTSDAFFYNAREHAALVMKARGGKDWEAWYSAVRDDLLDRRNKKGAWDDAKGPSLFNTAQAAMILQANSSQEAPQRPAAQKGVKKRSYPENMNADFKKLLVAQDAAKTALQGKWEQVGPDEIHRWTFTDESAVNEVIFKKTNEVIRKSVFAYHINPQTTPPEINLHTGADLILGIYRLKGDQLSVAYSGAWASALVRPKGFNSEDCGLDFLPLNTRGYNRLLK